VRRRGGSPVHIRADFVSHTDTNSARTTADGTPPRTGANLLDLCAVAVRTEGMPFGVTLLAPAMPAARAGRRLI
jgi:hypothetical protein